MHIKTKQRHTQKTKQCKKELNTNYPHKHPPQDLNTCVFKSCTLIFVCIHITSFNSAGGPNKQVQTTSKWNTSNHNQHNLPSNYPVNLSQVQYCNKSLSIRLLMFHANLYRYSRYCVYVEFATWCTD